MTNSLTTRPYTPALGGPSEAKQPEGAYVRGQLQGKHDQDHPDHLRVCLLHLLRLGQLYT